MLVFATGARRRSIRHQRLLAPSRWPGLPPDGRIVTLEVSPEHAEFARRHIAESPYADRIEVLLGPALEGVERLDGPFDFVFIDADKENYGHYYEAALPKLAPRGLIAADNTLWSGNVIDPDATGNARDLDSDERVVCVMLTVRDGVTLIRRRAA